MLIVILVVAFLPIGLEKVIVEFIVKVIHGVEVMVQVMSWMNN